MIDASSKSQGELHALMRDEDRALLRRCHQILEHPSLAARLSAVVGTPLEIGFKLLPRPWHRRLNEVAETSIQRALDAAVSSVRRGPLEANEDRFHQLIGVVSGAVGGYFGLPGLVLELPVSTTIMLRSIADIARHEGENLADMDSRLACVQVFALGGRTEQDDAAETGYYGVRLALALSVTNAKHAVLHGNFSGDGAPLLAQLVSGIAARFGVPVSQKAAAQMVPVVGAAGGAMLNGIFIHHFQQMAHSHFSVRRLERSYGPDVVRAEYDRLSSG